MNRSTLRQLLTRSKGGRRSRNRKNSKQWLRIKCAVMVRLPGRASMGNALSALGQKQDPGAQHNARRDSWGNRDARKKSGRPKHQLRRWLLEDT